MASLKAHVLSFWQWFVSEHTAMEEALEKNDLPMVTKKISLQLRHFQLPSRCRISVEEETQRIVLAIAFGENKTAQYINRFWAENAPQFLKETWVFLPYLPAAEHPDGIFFPIGEKNLFVDQLPVIYYPDSNRQKFDVYFVSDILAKAPTELQMIYLTQIVQAYLGEAVADIYLGKLGVWESVPPVLSADYAQTTVSHLPAIIREAPELLDTVWSEDPTQICYNYQPKENASKIGGIRSDVTAGYIRILDLLDEPEALSARLKAVGGVYCYLAFPNDMIEELEDSESFRNLAMHYMETLMQDYRLGYVIGTAVGSEYCYIDVIVFDEDIFQAVIKDIEFDLMVPAAIKYFSENIVLQ